MIRFVIAICPDPREELLFFLFSKLSKCSSLSPLIPTPEKLCLFIPNLPFFSMMFAKQHVYVTHAETPVSMAM